MFEIVALRALTLPAIATLAALVIEAWLDVRAERELSTAAKVASFVAVLALFAPAPVLGLLR